METRIEKDEIERAIQSWLYNEYGWNLKGDQIKIHVDSIREEVFANIIHADKGGENYTGR